MDLKEVMGKKKAEKDPAKKDAKMDALKAMRQAASNMMKDDMGGKLSEVSVMAKNPEDMEKGLDKAKELVGALPMKDEVQESPADEVTEDSHYDEAEELIDACQDPEELDQLMKMIADKKRELMMKKA